MRFVVDHVPIESKEDDSVLVAMLRADLHPTGGGCLCLAGDCPHCLATVDGVAYTRTCQVPARPGQVVERQHLGGVQPPLLRAEKDDAPDVPVRYVHADVVVIGRGASGRRAAEEARADGKDVVTLDAADGQEVAGIYHGPMVVARTDDGTLCLRARDEVVVATGAAEIQPVAPGNQLAGLVTARAASALADAGIDLGRVVAVGTPPDGIEAEHADGELVRFEGEKRVEAVVVRGADGQERRHPCDTVSLGLGFHPRDALVRMGRGLAVRAVGRAAGESDIPSCPRAGTVCPCAGVTVDDLASVWERGFHELELVKRATLAGTGTCQGAACLPHIRAFLADRGEELQPPFTARPMTRQLTVGEIAAGAFHRPTPRTALHDEHLRLGAHMERAGGWWRPWTYGDRTAEYWAVREAVSICDVGTLGKIVVSGPDAEALLEYLYPTRIANLKPGQSRYALLLDDRGYVVDDGLVCRDGAERFILTLTSAGSTFGELWIRDWAEGRGADVRVMNQTMSLGAINVTGPLAAELLARGGANALPGFSRHTLATVAGVDCRVFRLSFTGELSYELHHAYEDSVVLWRRLLELGRELGIKPHGLKTLLDLRLEKGHVIVHKDTDFDSTPRRLDHEWAVKLDKDHGDFVGRQAVLRTDKEPLDRRLVGLEMDSPAPLEGAVLWNSEKYAGYVTSSIDSPVLGKAVLLAWLYLKDGELPEEVTVDGRPARRVPTPFYDPDGARARVRIDTSAVRTAELVVDEGFQKSTRVAPISATRVVATPAALDQASWPDNCRVMRIAADEVLVTPAVASPGIDDRYAIVLAESGFAGVRLSRAEAERFLERTCAWEWPVERTFVPSGGSRGGEKFAQGAIADLPAKLWFEDDHVLILVPAPLAADLEERLRWPLGGT